MPTYEYRCKDCSHQFDAVQSFTDDALTECPACGGVLKKVFGSVGITFKGSGFYKTDSRGSKKSTTATSSSDSKSSESKSETKSESKSSETSSSSSEKKSSSDSSSSSSSSSSAAAS
jgi:putative FmdB family regulatory protein